MFRCKQACFVKGFLLGVDMTMVPPRSAFYSASRIRR